MKIKESINKLIPEFKPIKQANCIAVGGGIAFGKTTLINNLQKHIPNSVACYELAEDNNDTTRQELHNYLLKGLYEGKIKAELFQLAFVTDRFDVYKDKITKGVKTLVYDEPEEKLLKLKKLQLYLSNKLGNSYPVRYIGDENGQFQVDYPESWRFGCEMLNAHYEQSNPLILFDRTIFEDRLFAHQNMLDRPIQFTYYDQLWRDMISELLYLTGIPRLYIILDGSFETFEQRIFKRGRKVEVDNWERNKNYFKNLLSNYVPYMEGVCKKYGINYVVINVDNKSPEEVLREALKYTNDILDDTKGVIKCI